jgi:hypothetical protein
LCSLSLCAIVLRFPADSHVSTCNGQRSSQLFCVNYTHWIAASAVVTTVDTTSLFQAYISSVAEYSHKTRPADNPEKSNAASLSGINFTYFGDWQLNSHRFSLLPLRFACTNGWLFYGYQPSGYFPDCPSCTE